MHFDLCLKHAGPGEGGCPLCAFDSYEGTIKAMTETATEQSRVHVEMHNRIVELERTPIKCIWCGLRMATVEEAANHVLVCDKGPWVELRAENDRYLKALTIIHQMGNESGLIDAQMATTMVLYPETYGPEANNAWGLN